MMASHFFKNSIFLGWNGFTTSSFILILNSYFSSIFCRNYNAELVAFQARLGEKFDDSKLRDAFISSDYFDAEKERQRDLEITTDFCSNIQLAESGRKVIEESLRGYLRWAMPFLPEEGVDAFTHFLMQKKLLAHVSFHIGTMDLILSEVVVWHILALSFPLIDIKLILDHFLLFRRK